ncbi:YopX family protein [Streptococcus parasanguinis]|uniref:YopX family protein n=1 Tax=Streptococcus parasanguinis TaxID=1318 RepID=UPI00200135C8|nr:YopX family protein [Streptococcus parasanguinis]
MIPKFRAWHKTWEEMGKVKRIRFDDDGNVTTVLFMGKDLGTNAKIDEIELMQSTGLFDKNGKEVFVGDIIKCTRGCLHEVYIEKEYGGTYIGGMPAIYLKGIREGYAWTGDEEIIGNVYENPELLEVTE